MILWHGTSTIMHDTLQFLHYHTKNDLVNLALTQMGGL
jgi:hypothetical protein